MVCSFCVDSRCVCFNVLAMFRLTEKGYHNLRFILLLLFCGLRLSLVWRHLQSYLDMAHDRIEKMKKETGRISNVDLKRKVAFSSMFMNLFLRLVREIKAVLWEMTKRSDEKGGRSETNARQKKLFWLARMVICQDCCPWNSVQSQPLPRVWGLMVAFYFFSRSPVCSTICQRPLFNTWLQPSSFCFLC